MLRKVDKFSFGESDDLQILELPYSGHELFMVVLLPKDVDRKRTPGSIPGECRLNLPGYR